MARATKDADRPAAVFTIPAGLSFVDALAQGLLRRWRDDPLAPSRALVLLPTRRACRSLAEAFLRASEGRALILPRLVPLGDLDADELLFGDPEGVIGLGDDADLPPAMPALRRQLLLSRLILEWGRVQAQGRGDLLPVAASEDQAVQLAGELARLLDQVETEGIGFDGLAELVPADYAGHWQLTLEFLKIVTEQWPALLAAEGAIGAAERRRRLLESQAAAWRAKAPDSPIVVAGSTGSIPATAALIEVISQLPQGMVVLPGLDRSAGDETWSAIRQDPIHPQHGLSLLLQRLGLQPDEVATWPEAEQAVPATLRTDLINAALRPAATSDAWRDLSDQTVDADGRTRLMDALAGVRRIDCDAPAEESAVIALIMRQSLQRPGRTAALVTPDRALARRVATDLGRWDVEVDDSAGVPLGETVPGTFLRLTATMAADRFAPIATLAALKHPLAAGGLSEGAFRAQVRALELAVLRGPRPAPGLEGLKNALTIAAEVPTGLVHWLDDLEDRMAPFVAALDDPGSGLREIVAGHIAAAEALAASDLEGGAARLWQQEAGESAADFMAELFAAAANGPPLHGERYPSLLASLLAGRAVRPRYGSHPRLAILGPLEARLQHADVTILGGLNEGTWPAEVDPGPWLSRPMRSDFGLPSSERRIGLAAHDFVQAMAAPEVYLTRSTRVEGTPTVASRWLLRLDALLRALELQDALKREGDQWRQWAAALDRPEALEPTAPPAPRPPLEARPRELSVTQIETWMRDPYALYAAKILDLHALEPLDADPGAAQRGTLIHRVLERYVSTHPESPPVNPEAVLLRLGEEVFAPLRAKPGLHAFWWPRFLRIVHWFVEADGAQRDALRRSWAEVKGRLTLQTPGGPFVLSASADRIDLAADGSLAILDYKTGALPKPKDIELGFAPQLPLEAAIAAAGGFAGLPAGAVAGLAFWRLTGGEPPGEIRQLKGDAESLAAAALEGCARLVASFDDPATPYRALPRPERAPRYNDYLHLARVKEWAVPAASGDEA